MTKVSSLIDARIEDLRKCGLVIPKTTNAKRLLKAVGEDEFVDSDAGDPIEYMVRSILYFMASEGMMRDDSLPVGSRGCDVDFECIYGDGDYASLVRKFTYLAGQDSHVTELQDWVDVPRKDVLLKFRFKGKEYYFKPKIVGDWADEEVVKAILGLVRIKGYQFCLLPYGQPGVFLFLKNAVANKIRKLAPGIELCEI